MQALIHPAPPVATAFAGDIATLEREGFLMLPGLMNAHELRTLQGELEPWIERTPRCEGDFYGWKTTRVGGLLSKAPMVQHLALNPRILAIAETLLRPACDCIQLNLSQATRVHPGERAQAPHRDEEMWPNDTQDRHWLINVMWAVSDFTEDNGAPRLWPGSHRFKLDRTVDPRNRGGRDACGLGAGLLGITHAWRWPEPLCGAAHRNHHQLLPRVAEELRKSIPRLPTRGGALLSRTIATAHWLPDAPSQSRWVGRAGSDPLSRR